MEPGSSRSDSFDNLLDECDGWIITKNEKGKIKIAKCEEDESNIYEKTRDWIGKNVDKTKTDTFKLPYYEANKVVTFFIRDLLNCERVDCYFKFWDLVFNQVYICGTITSFFTKNEKYYIIVDDGTSSIACIIKKEQLAALKGTEPPDVPIDNNNVLLQAAHILRRKLLQLQDLVPSFSDLALGNIVKIIGRMTEYNSNRYVFINRIMKPMDDIDYYNHIQKLIKDYRKFYENITDS